MDKLRDINVELAEEIYKGMVIELDDNTSITINNAIKKELYGNEEN